VDAPRAGGNIIDICPVGALTNPIRAFAHLSPSRIERTASISIQDSMNEAAHRMDGRTHKVRAFWVPRGRYGSADQCGSMTRLASTASGSNHEDRLTTPLVLRMANWFPPWAEAHNLSRQAPMTSRA